MNDNTTKLLNDLAEKLSTTSDKLWAMLLHQARIQFWTNLIIYAACALISYALYRTCRHLFTRVDKDDQFEMPATIAVIISIIFVGVAVIGFLTTLQDTISALVNPEYWALTQILSTLKK
jgi:uncharacterized Tic20 family protein